MAAPAASATKSQKLAEIFSKMNLSELPAISAHVNEVLAATSKPQVTAEELAQVILRDFSLTNKVLQVVNSAYYSRGVAITTIERAVAALGISVIRELALSISLIEEFLKSGGEKEGISKQLTISLLSAKLSKLLIEHEKLPIAPEEAYVCTLLHDLGHMVLTIYLPDLARRIELAMASGSTEETISRLLLKQLTFTDIGQELARFWNFSETIIACMDTSPPMPKDEKDSLPLLQNIALFCNIFVQGICAEEDLSFITRQYKNIFSTNCPEMLGMCLNVADSIGGIADIVRYGLCKLRYRSKLITAMKKNRQLIR